MNEKANPARGSRGVDAVKFCIKQFLRRMVLEPTSLREQVIDRAKAVLEAYRTDHR